MSLYGKILEIQKKIQPVYKDGNNTFHKYRYVTEAALLEQVKPLLGEYGVIIVPTIATEESGFTPPNKDGVCKTWAKVIMSFRIIDADPEPTKENEIEATFVGYAEDAGDKAIYKAITGATKYFYMKFFCVATSDDPENEKEEPKPKQSSSNVKNIQQPATKKPFDFKAEYISVTGQYGLSDDDIAPVRAHFNIKSFSELTTPDNQKDALEQIKQIGIKKQLQGKAG